jgi:hypothetical protein
VLPLAFLVRSSGVRLVPAGAGAGHSAELYGLLLKKPCSLLVFLIVRFEIAIDCKAQTRR